MMPTIDFTIVHATDAQKPVVANLIQLYLYDMTDAGPSLSAATAATNTIFSTGSGSILT